MMKIILTFTILFYCVNLNAQTKSLAFFVNTLHNFNYRVNDVDVSIKRPLFILPSYGAEYYSKKEDKVLGFHLALGVVWEGIRLKRRFGPLNNGQPSNRTIIRATSGLGPSLRGGIFVPYKSLRIVTGLHFRFVSNGFVGISGPRVSENESFQSIAEYDNIAKNSIHSNIYINVDYKMFRSDRTEVRLNFIGNIGLHPIYRTTSIIENFVTNKTTRVVHTNYGTYIGLGLKLVRSTDGRFKDIFSFKWK